MRWMTLQIRIAQRGGIEPGFDFCNRRARTMSWMSVGEDIGEILGPIFAGFLWSAFGVAVLLVGRALVAAGVEVYAIWVSRRLQQKEAFPHSQLIAGVDAAQS